MGWFRSIDTLQFPFEFKFKFQIRLWIGNTTIAPWHQQTHIRGPGSFYKLAVKITHFVDNYSLKLAVKTRSGTNNSSKPAVKILTTTHVHVHGITGHAYGMYIYACICMHVHVHSIYAFDRELELYIII